MSEKTVAENEVAEKPASVRQAPGNPRGVRFRGINLSRKMIECPKCGTVSKRHSEGTRQLREIGITSPVVLVVTYSKHYCTVCRKHFSQPMEHIAMPSGRFTNRVRRAALDMVSAQQLTLEKAANRMRQKYFVHVPPTTLHDWVVSESMLAP